MAGFNELGQRSQKHLLCTLSRDPLVSARGRLAQMVERSLSMREAPGSIPGLSNNSFDNSFLAVPLKKASLFWLASQTSMMDCFFFS